MALLTARSQKRVLCLHVAFCFVLVWNIYAVYLYFIEPFVKDPFLRSPAFWRYWLKTEPLVAVLSVLFVYLNVCLYICSGFIILTPIIGAIWSCVKHVLPCRIRRRTWCFCNCSLRSLEKILHHIYNTQCDWEPQRPETIDSVTRNCITLILRRCQEELGTTQDMTFSIVGSSAEGLGKAYTLDLESGYLNPAGKFCLRFFCCCCPCSTSYTSLRTDFDINLKCEDTAMLEGGSVRMESDRGNGTSGFVRVELSIEDNSTCTAKSWLHLTKQENGKTYLSSSMVRRKIFDTVDATSESVLPASYVFGVIKHPPVVELEEKGPAVKLATYPLGQAWYWNEDQKFVSFEGDFVFGIKFMKPWPDCARRWQTRPRMWPLPADVNRMVAMGFLLVPKSSHHISELQDELEWHICFPHCETYICDRMPKAAKACYLAIKLIMKTHLVYHFEDMKTYYLKTVLLWELEKHPASFWDPDNLSQCFTCLFDGLISCVSNKRCPNYWIEDLDLFQSVDKQELGALVPVLIKIRSNPATYIEDIGSLWC